MKFKEFDCVIRKSDKRSGAIVHIHDETAVMVEFVEGTETTGVETVLVSELEYEIGEETEVEYSQESDLSYKDSGDTHVELFVRNERLGLIKVFKDSEMDNREYVCINYNIVYLDTMRKL